MIYKWGGLLDTKRWASRQNLRFWTTLFSFTFKISDPKSKISCVLIKIVDIRNYENSVGNNKQLLQPEGHIIFFKYDTNFEEHLLKLQS